MKKNIILLIFITISLLVNSQNLTIKGGVCFSKINSDFETTPYEDIEYNITFNPGLSVGIAYSIQVTKKLIIEPNILFNEKGNRAETIVNSIESVGCVNHYHLDIPIYLRYNIGLIKDIKTDVFAGPYIGYGLLANMKIDDNEPIKLEYESENDLGESLQRLDYGVSFGIAAEKRKCFIEATYDIGMKNKIENPENFKYKYKVIRILLGYRFGK